MYPKKTPKSQEPDKTPFTSHKLHDTELVKTRDWSKSEYMNFVSIDPGIQNFALRIERRTIDGVSIECQVFEKIAFKKQVDSTAENDIFSQLTTFLDQFSMYYNNVHIVIIERQMTINYKMVRLSMHVISYFMNKLKNLPLLPLILEIDSKLKSRALNAPNMTKYQLKKWAVTEALDILEYRGDYISIDIMKSTKGKHDDLADTVVQIEAFCAHCNMAYTPRDADKLT